MRIVALLLLWASVSLTSGCRTQVAATEADAQKLSRADAARLLPASVNFYATANLQAVVQSQPLRRQLALVESMEPFGPWLGCGVELEHLEYLILGGQTDAERSYVAILSSPQLGAPTLDCFAGTSEVAGTVEEEGGRRVLLDETSGFKAYVVAPGVLAFASPQLQSDFETRLSGGGEPATMGALGVAVDRIDADTDLALALVSDRDLARDAPGLASIALDARIGEGFAARLVSAFEDPAVADRVAKAVDLEVWRDSLEDAGIPSSIVDSVEVEVDGKVASLELRMSPEEFQGTIDVLARVAREELDMSQAAQVEPTPGGRPLDDVDAEFLKELSAAYRAEWADGDLRADLTKRCLGKFVPELDERIREAYCLCVADGLEDVGDAAEDCTMTLFPIIYRVSGLEECEMIHGARACQCWADARETSASRYLRASEACLDQG